MYKNTPVSLTHGQVLSILPANFIIKKKLDERVLSIFVTYETRFYEISKMCGWLRHHKIGLFAHLTHHGLLFLPL